MWDFSVGRALWVMLRTWPFVLLRLVVYFAITLAYIMATGLGAGVGWGAGHVFSRGGPEGAALVGAIAGFGFAAMVVYWLREYILYVLKAGHIAAMVHMVEGREIPAGRGQIAYAREVVTARFAEANVLFLVDQLVKGALGAVKRLIGGVAALLPFPGLHGLVAFINTVIRISITYIDELILAYNIRVGSSSPFETARQGVVLYAQNGKAMIRNAIWLAFILWAVILVIFLLMLVPAGAVVYLMPGQPSGWGFVLAIIFAWGLKAALVEPFAIACLMQAYFRNIQGQTPDPDWDRRLAEASAKFRELKERASTGLGGRQPGTATDAA